jgi:hypothetical protein
VDFEFGASPAAPAPLALDGFRRMLHQPGPGSDATQKSDPNHIQATLSFDIDNVVQVEGAPESGAAFKFILETEISLNQTLVQ